MATAIDDLDDNLPGPRADRPGEELPAASFCAADKELRNSIALTPDRISNGRLDGYEVSEFDCCFCIRGCAGGQPYGGHVTVDQATRLQVCYRE